MKRYILGIASGICIMLVTSCTPVYIPNVVNMPLLNETGEIQASVHTAVGGIDVQTAAAITDRLGMMVNANFQDKNIFSGEGYRKNAFGEFGLGYRTDISDNGRFEIFSGFGYGKTKARYPDNEFYWKQTLDIQSLRLFIQPTIGFTSDVVDFGLAPRMAYLTLNESGARYSGFFVEPAFMLKLGYKYVKLLFQAGISLPAYRNSLQYDYNPFIGSFGLQFAIKPNKITKKEE